MVAGQALASGADDPGGKLPAFARGRDLREDLASLGLAFEPLSAVQAEIAGQLKERTRRYGLSLGDRACLALGSDRGEPICTADRVWEQLDLDVEVESIR